MSNLISVDRFYSKSLHHHMKSKFRLLAETEDSERDKTYKVDFKLTGPSVQRREFTKQDEALEYVALDEDLSIFSWEIGAGGQRKFLVCSKETFWAFYKNLDRKHYYEVIPRNRSCKLYFDLEFLVEHNQGKEGHEMTQHLVNIANKKLQTEFSCSSFLEDVLILESSNEKKFSIHLIFQKAIFPNNELCGTFVKSLMSSLTEEDRKLFQVQDQDGNPADFIDVSVYSKNRNFRLYLSTKFGKLRQFTVSVIDLSSVALLEDNPEQSRDDSDWKIFSSSLITNVSNTDSLISCSGNTTCSNSVRLTRSEHSHPQSIISSSSLSFPYPEVQEFICQLVTPGWVRRWRTSGLTSHFTFDIGGTRYCSNVGREHRSNHVYYTCELSRGVVWQGCYDPGCSGYRGPEIEIPGGVLAWADLADWSDEELMPDEDDEFLLEGSHGY